MLLLISSLYLNIEINNWMSYIWFLIENNTSCAGFFGFGLNKISQLCAHLEIVSRSFVRSVALSSLFITTEKWEILSANNLTIYFNPSGQSLIYIKKNKVRKWILEELPTEQASSLNTDHLEKLFEI